MNYTKTPAVFVSTFRCQCGAIWETKRKIKHLTWAFTRYVLIKYSHLSWVDDMEVDFWFISAFYSIGHLMNFPSVYFHDIHLCRKRDNISPRRQKKTHTTTTLDSFLWIRHQGFWPFLFLNWSINWLFLDKIDHKTLIILFDMSKYVVLNVSVCNQSLVYSSSIN